MKKVSKLIVVMFAVLMMFSLTACSSKDTDKDTAPDTTKDAETDAGTDTATDDTAEPTGGNILNVHFDVEVASMDPQIATDGTSFEVLAAVTEGLYSIDAAGTPIMAMAEAVDKSADGLTYTFTLKDAQWSNGTPVTSKDFLFAWKRLVDPAVASEYSFIADIAGIKNAAKITAGEVAVDQLGVTAPDDKTLVVQLDVPVPFFESLMAFPSFLPVNEAFFTAAGDTYGTSPETILSNGPFTITAYEPAATTITLAKSTTYWDAAKVALDGIQYQVIKDSQQAMLSYQNGDLDVATLSGEQVEQFQADPEFHNIMAGYLWYVTPNQKVAGIENVNLRKALALSYDKAAIANNILKDGSIVADFAVPTLLAVGPDGKDFRATTGTYLTTDKAKALEYWEKAKAELGVSELKYTLIVEDTESAINVAQFIQSEIQTTLPGITIELQSMPKKNRVERIQAGEYELCLTRWGPDYADPMTYLDMWTSDSPNNYGLWSNAEYDALIESAKKGELALDLTARWEALKKAETMVMDEAVIFPVYQKGDAVMIKAGVEGIEFHSVGINRIYKDAKKN
ncbi:MAG: Oligopeptide transport system substrate-binding protein [Herbinix sp.]|jgi:oligopeptide transport system substrate-binding protein|nr:Oligopeptide transport system substrate-binding protein [Herbinix sp.]